MDSLHLRSVNWQHGMLLTPDHFLRQERYLESVAMWATSFLTASDGLVGGGVRLPESDLGAVRHDPIVVLSEDAESLRISVSQCRGVTPSGLIVDIDSAITVSEQFAKNGLAGVVEAVVYVIHDTRRRAPMDGVADTFNPQMRSERTFAYRVSLECTAAERENALAVTRIQRPIAGVEYEKDPRFIPRCASISAHSELTAGWRRIVEMVHTLSSGYAELHRAMREFMVLFTERGIETEVDRDSVAFAERMVMALQDASYAVLDRTQSPAHFFAALRKLIHQSATYFDLAPGMQQYYEMLRQTGETELARMIDSQKYALQTGRTLKLEQNLQTELQRNLQSIAVLEKLERALEGKYIDFRRSPALEGANFIFDRGGKVLYRLAAKPARVQGVVDESTIYFSQLRLEGRDKYRLILVGETTQPFERGTKISVEIRLNEGSGFRRAAIILTAEAKLEDQYNLEFDFDAPDVPTITDVRVTVPAAHGIRTALLFIRHRFYAGAPGESPAALSQRETPRPEPLPFASGRGQVATSQAMESDGPQRSSAVLSVAERMREDRSVASMQPANGHSAGEHEESLPPWMPRSRDAGASGTAERDEADAKPARRRRLE